MEIISTLFTSKQIKHLIDWMISAEITYERMQNLDADYIDAVKERQSSGGKAIEQFCRLGVMMNKRNETANAREGVSCK